MSVDPQVEPDDNPEWTDEDFASARPANEVLPPEVAALLVRGGRPALDQHERKQPVSLRLSPRVIEHFRATGPGWQTRINDTLERAIVEERQHAR